MSAANNVATTTNVPALPQMVLTADWFVEELVGSKMCVSAHSCETNVSIRFIFMARIRSGTLSRSHGTTSVIDTLHVGLGAFRYSTDGPPVFELSSFEAF